MPFHPAELYIVSDPENLKLVSGIKSERVETGAITICAIGDLLLDIVNDPGEYSLRKVKGELQ